MAHICSVLPHFICEGTVGEANSTSLHGLFPLSMDQAYVTFVSTVNTALSIYENNDMCDDCRSVSKGTVKANRNFTYVVSTDTTRTLTLKYESFSNDEGIVCRERKYFNEYGDYYININNASGNIECSKAKLLQTVPYETNQWFYPDNYFWIFILLIVFAFTPTILKYSIELPLAVIRYFFPSRQTTHQAPVYSKTDKPIQPLPRFFSLDVFRGLNVGLMLFGNAGAAEMPYFYHTVWHGMNIAELPHGWFNWMLGISYVIFSNGTKWRSSTPYEKLKLGFSRTARLFFAGLVLNSIAYTNNLDRLPYFGVLTGMGFLYLILVLMDLILPKKRRFLKSRVLNFMDLGTLWGQWLIIFAAAIVQNSILFGLDVPGCGRGYLGPGGMHMYGKYKNCTGGAAGYIDRWLIGSVRMPYPLPFSWFYGTSTKFDPYGPFSIIGQLIQVYLGVLAGETLLLHRNNPNAIFKRWLATAVLLTLISLIFCNVPFGYCYIPYNRRLWTITYSCVVGVTALLLYTVVYFIVDVKKFHNGWPLYYLGRNSLFIYVVHLLTKQAFPFTWPTPRRHLHLFFQHWTQAFWWLIISGYLYHKNYFFTA